MDEKRVEVNVKVAQPCGALVRGRMLQEGELLAVGFGGQVALGCRFTVQVVVRKGQRRIEADGAVDVGVPPAEGDGGQEWEHEAEGWQLVPGVVFSLATGTLSLLGN